MPDSNNATTSGDQAAAQMQQSTASATPPDNTPAPTQQPATPQPAALAPSDPSPAAGTAATPPPQPTPQQVQAHHDSLIGNAARFLLGTPMQYSVGADGKTVATPQPQQPGQLFRSILAGAILGGAVGSQNKTGSGLASGAQGAAAVMEKAQQQDTQRRTAAQQDFQNQQAADAASQAKIYQAAQIAHMHVQDLHNNAELDLQSKDHLDKLNDLYDSRESAALAAGAKPAQIIVGGKDINATPGNGKLIMSAMQSNPEALKAPDGFSRVPVQHTDYTGLHEDPEKGWVDKDGNYVDLADRTTHTLYDVPDNVFKKTIKMTGKQIEATGLVQPGTLDPNANYTTTLGDVASMTTAGGKNLQEAAQTKLEGRRVQLAASQVALEGARFKHQLSLDNAQQMRGAFEVAQNRVTSLNDQLKTIDFSFPGGTEMKTHIMDKLDSANQDLQDTYNRIYNPDKKPATGGGGNSAAQVKPFVDSDGTHYQIPVGEVSGFLKFHPNARQLGTPTPPQQFVDPGGPPEQNVIVQWPSGSTSTMPRAEFNSSMASQNDQTQRRMKGAKIAGIAPPAAAQKTPDITSPGFLASHM